MAQISPPCDWRPIVSALRTTPVFASSWVVELLECVTETSLPDIDAALDDWSRSQFRQEVFAFDRSLRLGSDDCFDYIPSPEVPWTPEWEQRMALAARYYLERADDSTREALRQLERLHGWSTMAPASRPAAMAALELTLHPDPHVADIALSMQHVLAPPLPEVLAWCVPVLRCGEPERVRAGLAVLRNALGQSSALLGWKPQCEVEQRLCMALAGRPEAEVEALVTRLPSSSPRWPADVAASCVAALGITAEVMPLLTAALTASRPRQSRVFDFIAALGKPAAGARALVLEHLERAGSHDAALPCLRALGRMGTPAGELLTLAQRWTGTGPEPRRKEMLRTLIGLLEERGDGESEELPALCRRLVEETQAPEERVELVGLLIRMSPSRRQSLFPGLAAPAELLAALLEDTREKPPDLLQERLLELHRDSSRLHAWLMVHAMENPDDALSSSFFRVAGPECGELIAPLRRLITERSARCSQREGWVQALGRIAPGPDSPALRVLHDLFLDTRERLPLRLTAARTLWSAGVRGLPGTELAPALRDRSAALRSWALLLAGEVEAGLLASLREDPVALVRQIAMASGRAGASWPGGSNGGPMP